MSGIRAEIATLRRRLPRPVVAPAYLDPVAMAERAGFALDPWQRDTLWSKADQTILLVTRQGGKSTVSSIAGLHQAVYTPGSLVLLLSPSLRQSQELFKKVMNAYERLRRPVPAVQESALQLELANGSRVIALPGKESTIRGYSGVSLLIEDEAARVPDELYMATRPMLAVSGGRLVLLSTPFGRRGHFHEEWEHGGPGWKRVRVTAEQCPRISADWLEAERAAIGDWWYRQEYGCEFVANDTQLFDYEVVMGAFTSTVPPLGARTVETPAAAPVSSIPPLLGGRRVGG